MFTKFVVKFVPRLIANPALAIEMAPVLVIVGAAAAVCEVVKNHQEEASYKKANDK